MSALQEAYRAALAAAYGGARVHLSLSPDLDPADLAPIPATIDPTLPPTTVHLTTTRTVTREAPAP